MLVKCGRRLWRDERASTEAVSWLLLTVVIALGGVVGIASVRDSITQQLGDLAVALESLDQSYSFSVVTPNGTITSVYDDADTTLTDPVGQAPACINVSVAAAAEGS